MTHAEMILSAVNEFRKQGKTSFTREDIRASLGINSVEWSTSFSPIFQGMRTDQPGGAPAVGKRFRNVFRKVSRGVYVLTDFGKTLVSEINTKNADLRELALPADETTHILNDPNPNPPHEIHIPHHQRTRIYTEKVQLILQNAETYHQAYYRSETFGNPCLYFHLQALKTRQDPTSVKHLEYIYATLIAWGMNRPGKNGSKMVDFKTFHESIVQLESCILASQTFVCTNMDESKWEILEKVFKNIKIMKSRTSLVGNSKVMHHMFPNIIPPIDREYTLSFLHGNTNIQNDLDAEWQLMKGIIETFFIPIATDNSFNLMANNWMKKIDVYPWDTSVLKIIDNILIGAKKSITYEGEISWGE
jgi:hypothetical protein